MRGYVAQSPAKLLPILLATEDATVALVKTYRREHLARLDVIPEFGEGSVGLVRTRAGFLKTYIWPNVPDQMAPANKCQQSVVIC